MQITINAAKIVVAPLLKPAIASKLEEVNILAGKHYRVTSNGTKCTFTFTVEDNGSSHNAEIIRRWIKFRTNVDVLISEITADLMKAEFKRGGNEKELQMQHKLVEKVNQLEKMSNLMKDMEATHNHALASASREVVEFEEIANAKLVNAKTEAYELRDRYIILQAQFQQMIDEIEMVMGNWGGRKQKTIRPVVDKYKKILAAKQSV